MLSQSDINQKARAIDVRKSRAKAAPQPAASDTDKQLSLFDFYPEEHPVLKEIRQMDLSNMTPLQALTTLDAFQRSLKKDDPS